MVDSGIGPRNRLWTPWRMTYVTGSSHSPTCVFCAAASTEDDVRSLVVHRGEHAYVMLNLYPYNTGHLMVIPYDHVSHPAELSPEARAELAELSASFATGLSKVMGCDGLNMGVNLGSAAGAGIADHLHQHLVPRWIGDANFMPLIGETKVLPELLPATYAKIRSEVARQQRGDHSVALVLLSGDRLLMPADANALPRAVAEPDVPLWKAAAAMAQPWVSSLTLVGWGGPVDTRQDASQEPVLVYAAEKAANSALVPHSFNDAVQALNAQDAEDVAWSRDRFGPATS